jgi:hypothetical protein
MLKAHAVQKGAAGLDLGDEKGHKEMIDAPMLKQVRSWADVLIHSPEYPRFRQKRLSKWRALPTYTFQYCHEDDHDESFES